MKKGCGIFRSRVFNLFILFVQLSNIQTLKCRTREQVEQQTDFYGLASDCMRTSMNLTKFSSEDSTRGSRNSRHPQQGPMYSGRGGWNNNEQQREENGEFEGNSNRGRQRNGNNRRYKVHNTGNNQCEPGQDDTRNPFENFRDEEKQGNQQRARIPNRYHQRDKRSTLILSKLNGKNSTRQNNIKSPLQDINSCVIHCIFREMNMLNSASQPDRSSMSKIMAGKIQNSELQEFIQDSIDECFDILETENDSGNEEDKTCDFSKRLLLCLEEKAQRGCEDWNEDEDFKLFRGDEEPDDAYRSNRNANNKMIGKQFGRG